MKKIVSLLLVYFVATSLSAQTFDFSLNGGLTMGQIDGDRSAHYNHLGYQAGVNTSFPINDNLRMLVEIGVIHKGSEVRNATVADRSVGLNYVHLPLLLTYNMKMSRDKNLRVSAGVAPAFLFHATAKDGDEELPLVAENYKRWDLLPFVADATLFFSQHIGLSVRYYNSLIGIEKHSAQGTYRIFRSNKGVFNNLISFCLNYRF